MLYGPRLLLIRHRAAYYYTLFKPLGFRWGQPAPPSPRKDPGKGRAFVIELVSFFSTF